jgi:predicted acyltransferase
MESEMKLGTPVAGPTARDTKGSGRITSIDALRGFTMFWITGGAGLAHSLHRMFPNAITAVLSEQCDHVRWQGFHFYDLIFPLFVFIVGVVLPFSLTRHTELGTSRKQLYLRVVRRLLLLLVLGLIYNGLLQNGWHDLRIAGVLQRIAVCYFFAALVVIKFRVRAQAILVAVLLLGYWAAMTLIPVPGVGSGVLTPAGNLSGFVDRHVLPRPFCCYDFGDSEGLLSTIPAIGTALLGCLAGHWLSTKRMPARKAAGLAVAGVLSLTLGLLWGQWFPIIKNIWTSSYVLFAAGWSLLLLAFFYWIIDVRGYKRWAFFFIVIGANAITIYVLRSQISLGVLLKYLGYGRVESPGAYWDFLWKLVDLAAGWLLLWVLFRRRIFLRV